MAVHRQLGPGLREATYQRALANALTNVSLEFETQKLYPVYDDPSKNRLVGYYVPDFLVAGAIVVEIKALHAIDNRHLAQIIAYLAVSACPIGLLINFGERSLRYRRIFPPQTVIDYLVNRQWLFVPDWLKNDENGKK